MKSRVAVIAAICLILTLVVALCACKHKEETPESLTPMSEVRLEDHFLSWDPVEGALLYSVKIMFDQYNGYEIPVEGTRYALAIYSEGTYTIYVRPVLEAGYGAYSEPVVYTIKQEVAVTPSEDGKVILRGAGTYEDPILIYTREDLASITDGKREVTKDGETTKLQNYYLLKQDIDLSGEEWTSIGSSAARFEGLFDGNGHTIKGLTQTKLKSASSRYNCGLFAELGKATIVNLVLEDVDIRLGLVNEEFRVGGLAGYSVGATIENCRVSGNITVNSAQSTQKAAYVGMLIGYSNGTDMRRIVVEGNVDVTYAKVYAGGLTGICTSASADVINDVLSYVNVHSYGTGYKINTPAGRAYSAGIAYLSNVSSVANVAWMGKADTSVVMGTPADEEMYAEGMFVVGGSSIVNGQSQIKIEDCFFDIEGIAYDKTAYAIDNYATNEERLRALANRYAMGNAKSQKRTSSVYCVDVTNRGVQAAYMPKEDGQVFGLDFDSVWRLTTDQEKPLDLQGYRAEWFTVSFVNDEGEAVSVQHVLKGHTANPPVYLGDEEHAVQWDFNAATLITSDMTIHILHSQE